LIASKSARNNPNAQEPQTVPAQPAKKTVLIVDDELEMQVFLSTLLESRGFKPVVAGSGVEGIQKAEALHPALIILDATLPMQGGAMMFRKLKCNKDLCGIPVLLLSSVDWNTYHHYQKIQETQSDDEAPEPEAFLNKPPEADELLTIVADLAEGATTT
jgi:CheY-like chemotaxis protein